MSTADNNPLVKGFKSFARKLIQPAGFYPIKYYTKSNKLRKSGYMYAVK